MKIHSRLIYQILSLTTLTVLLPLFQNCGAQRPSVEISSFATTGYSHSGAETSCSACHDISRPLSGVGFLSLNTNTTFNLATHGGGTDCYFCHDSSSMNVGSRIKAEWAKGYFDHVGNTDSCNSCHVVPQTLPNGNAHQVVAAGVQCTQCHKNNTANPPQNILTVMNSKVAADYPSLDTTLWAGASPGLVVADTTTPLNVYSPTYIALTSATNPGIFSSWTAKSQTVIKYMDHDSASIPVGMNSSCTNCHTNSTGASMAGAKFHERVPAMGLTQPSSCVDCHGSGLPVSTKGSTLPVKGTGAAAFVWSGAKTLTTTTALFNHDSSVGKAECATCHGQTNWAAPIWSAGKYHSNSAVPSTCTECHSPARPAGIVGGTMDHSKSGMGECAACHQASTSGVSPFTSWQGGLGGAPTGLSGGTSKLTPVATTINKTGTLVTGRTVNANLSLPLYMDHSAIVTTNCATCHTGVANAVTKFHANMAVPSTVACTTCHSNANNAAPGAVLGWDQVKPIDHAQVGNDCKTCHGTPTATTTLNFKDGRFHSKLTTQPTTCASCHAVKVIDVPIQNGESHASKMNADCSTCHSFPGINGTVAAPTWVTLSGAPSLISYPGQAGSQKTTADKVDTALAANATMPIIGTATAASLPHPVVGTTACTACHSNVSALYPSMKAIAYDHGGGVVAVTALVGKSCSSCHESGGTAGNTMMSAPFNLTTSAGDSRPVGMTTLTVKGFPGCTITGASTGVKNHFYPTDCTACHKAPTGIAGSSTGPVTGSTSPWAFTSAKHKPSGVSCTLCHGSTASCPN